jgi:beta-1,4-N-acetylglucosaminyltransferase
MSQKKHVLLTSSAGGHYAQLNRLIDFNIFKDYIVITEKTKIKTNRSNEIYLIYGTTKSIVYPFILVLNSIASLYYLIKYRPSIIISTGVHSTLPLLVIGKLFRKKIVYIESFAKVYTGSRTGLFVYRHKLYDYFIVQWKELLDVYPDAIYGGSLY